MKTLDDSILELVKICDTMELNSVSANLDYTTAGYQNYKVNIAIDIQLDTDEIDDT